MEGPVRQVRRAVGAAVLVVALTGTVVACGGGDSDKSGSRHSSTSDTSAKSYVGLTEKEAIAKAEASDTPWRITREDDETFLVTQDFVENRINFEIDNGKVTKATYG
jgi:hypothetical protein